MSSNDNKVLQLTKIWTIIPILFFSKTIFNTVYNLIINNIIYIDTYQYAVFAIGGIPITIVIIIISFLKPFLKGTKINKIELFLSLLFQLALISIILNNLGVVTLNINFSFKIVILSVNILLIMVVSNLIILYKNNLSLKNKIYKI